MLACIIFDDPPGFWFTFFVCFFTYIKSSPDPSNPLGNYKPVNIKQLKCCSVILGWHKRYKKSTGHKFRTPRKREINGIELLSSWLLFTVFFPSTGLLGVLHQAIPNRTLYGRQQKGRVQMSYQKLWNFVAIHFGVCCSYFRRKTYK